MPGRRRREVNDYAVVLVTAPDMDAARKLAHVCLESRTAACVNIVTGLESHYWWQGKIEHGEEILLLIKTTSDRLAALEKCVMAHHPYDTPEFVVLPVAAGSERYLTWISESVADPKSRKRQS